MVEMRFVGRSPFFAGWNVGKPGKKELSPLLIQIQLPVIENELCKQIYRQFPGYDIEPHFNDTKICTGFTTGDKDNCYGDSGGPVMLPIYRNKMYSFYQIGIISWDKSCAQPNIPSINTNVQFYAKWIEKKLKIKTDI